MWVLICIGIGMMQAVQNGVGISAQVRRPLRYPGKHKEKTLPTAAHAESLVGRIAVLEEGLREKAKVPVGDKKYNNGHSYFINDVCKTMFRKHLHTPASHDIGGAKVRMNDNVFGDPDHFFMRIK